MEPAWAGLAAYRYNPLRRRAVLLPVRFDIVLFAAPMTPATRQSLTWSAVALAFVFALWKLGPVLTPFAAAALLAFVLEPGVRWLHAKRVPRVLAVIISILVAALSIAALTLILIPIVQKETVMVRTQLPQLVARFTDTVLPQIQSWLGSLFKLDIALIRQWLTEHLASSSDELAARVLQWAKSGGGLALQVAGLVFLVPVVLFYVLLDWDKIWARWKELIPPRWSERVLDAAAEIDHLLAQYLRGQFLLMLSLALYYSVALLIARFELWLPIGVLTGLLIFVPYLGFALGLLFATLAGVLQFGPLHGLIAAAIVYGVGQVLESVFLTPRLIGERIGLHPLAVILALLAFGYLFGFVGVLLALPLAATLSVGLRRLRAAYKSSEFFSRAP